MIQINLVPDVKQEFLRAQRTRKYVISIAVIAGVASIAVAVLVGALVLGQIGRGVLAQNSIDSEYEKLSSVEDLSELVTIQNQLTQISTLNEKRSMDSRLFDILVAINPKAPNNAKFSSVTINPEDNSLLIEGTTSGGYLAVETLKKTITNAKLETKQNNETVEMELATSVVVGETSFGEDSSGDLVLQFQMTMNYAPGLLDNTIKDAKIIAPTGRRNVTDSRTRVPDSLFTSPATDVEEKE